MHQDVKHTIRTFILSQYLQGESPANVGDDLRLISSGLLDSLATLELAGFVQQAFGVKLSATDLLADSFDRIEDIARLVARKRAA